MLGLVFEQASSPAGLDQVAWPIVERLGGWGAVLAVLIWFMRTSERRASASEARLESIERKRDELYAALTDALGALRSASLQIDRSLGHFEHLEARQARVDSELVERLGQLAAQVQTIGATQERIWETLKRDRRPA